MDVVLGHQVGGLLLLAVDADVAHLEVDGAAPASSIAFQRRGTSRRLSPHQVPRNTITSAPGSTAASARAASASGWASTSACTQSGRRLDLLAGDGSDQHGSLLSARPAAVAR